MFYLYLLFTVQCGIFPLRLSHHIDIC